MSSNDYFQIYIQIISQAFRRVKKIGFKKYAAIKQLIDVAENFLAKQVYGRIEPSHYLLVMIVILGSKTSKLYSPILSAIQRLFSYNFINPNEEIAGSLKLLKEEHRQFLLLPIQDYEKKSFKEIYIQTIINMTDKDDGLNLNIAKSLSLIWRLDENSIPIPLLEKIFDFLIENMPLNKQQQEQRMIKSVVLEMFRHSLQSYKQVYDRKFLYEDNSISLKSVCSKYTSIIADNVALKLDILARYSLEDYTIIPLEDSQQPFVLYMSKQVNEKGQTSGKFGWCIFCRQTANYYCKQNRLPVCSFQCKHSIINQLQSIQKFISQEQRSAEIYQNHIIQLFVLFKKYLSSNDMRKRISFAQIFVMMTSQLKKIVDRLTPRMYKMLRMVVRQVIINIYSESEALVPCMATLKKLIQLRIFLDQTEIVLRLFAKKLTYFLTPAYVRDQILRFIKDIINNKILFDCTMALDCSPQRYDAVKELIDAVRQVYISIPVPQTITVPPFEDLNAKKLSMEVMVLLLKVMQERQKKMKQNQELQLKTEKSRLNKIRANIQLFNKSQKPLKIVKKWVQSNFIENQPIKIATFMHQNLKRLNLTNVGALIGDIDAFAGQIRKQFIGQITFLNSEIDQAMRILLKNFTLPGQSQVVQRIVQTFGIQFFNQSKARGIFVNSDAVYSFSYLLMMLQSNLHNPQVPQKMTLPQFSKLSKGMNGAPDAQFPPQFLLYIYNSVLKTPLGVHEKLKQIQIIIAYNTNPKKAQQIYLKDIQRDTTQKLSAIQQSPILYLRQYQHYPWSIFISQFFDQIIDIFACKIRDLQQKDKQQLLKYIQYIQTCLRIANQEKISKIIQRGIEKIWQQIQKSNTSKKYLLMEAMFQWAKKFSQQIVQQWKTIIYLISKFHRSKSIKKDSKNTTSLVIIENRCYLLENYIEQLITKTSKLSLKNVIGFLKALLIVSKDQIADNGSSFCLQKINQVLQLNIGRSLDIFNLFWNELRQYYIELGKHKIQKIALFATDFIKQLVTKFIKRKELLYLQKDYLRPFQQIFANTKIFAVKELTISGIHNFVTNHSTLLKSGWKVILSILCNCFQEEQNSIIKEKGYHILKKISQNNFGIFPLSQNYNDFVQILNKLAREKEQIYGLGTLQIIKQIIEYYHIELGINLERSADDQQNKKLDINFWQTIFLPLLSIIFPICGDSRTSVQSPAIAFLFEILFKYGKLFKYEFWKMVLQGVLRPAFEEITYTSQSKPLKKSQLQTWLKHSFTELFKSINQLIVLYYNDFRLFLEDVFKIYENCILNHSLKLLIVLSLQALNDLLKQIAIHFEPQDWETYLIFAQSLFKKTLPTELSSLDIWNKSKDLLQTNYQAKCFALYLFLSKSQEIYEKYPQSITQNIYNDTLKQLDILYKFVSEFNRNLQLRETLWKNGFYPEVKLLPGLIKHHYQILKFKLKIYFALIKINQSYIHQYFKLALEIFELANALQLKQHLKEPSLRDFERQRLKNNYKQLLQQTIYNQLETLGIQAIYKHNKDSVLLQESLKLLGNRIYCTKCTFCQSCQNNSENNKALNQNIQRFIMKLFKFK